MKLYLFASALVATMLFGASASATTFPEGSIKLIVPYAPGGSTDAMARTFAEGLGKELKVPVVVENRPGAGTAIGTAAAATAPKDGRTLVMATNGNMVLTPILYPNLPFDAAKDFQIFAIAAESPVVALTGPTVPVNNLKEFAQYAKSKSGNLFFGTIGQGNVLHITTKVMESMLGVKMIAVPYKGSSPALTATMAGEVQLFVDVAATSLPLVKAGKLKAIAVANRQRLDTLPDVATFAESGYPAFHAASWSGLAVASGTPEPILTILQAAAQRAMAAPKFQESVRSLGLVNYPMVDRRVINEFVATDRTRWAELVKLYNITAE